MIDIETSGRFGSALKEAVENKGISLSTLAMRVNATYEHMRKLVAGRAYPSVHLLQALATELGVSRTKFEELSEADKLHKKYRHLPKFLDIAPELEPFQPIIPKLSKEGQQTLLAMARTLLHQERARGR